MPTGVRFRTCCRAAARRATVTVWRRAARSQAAGLRPFASAHRQVSSVRSAGGSAGAPHTRASRCQKLSRYTTRAGLTLTEARQVHLRRKFHVGSVVSTRPHRRLRSQPCSSALRTAVVDLSCLMRRARCGTMGSSYVAKLNDGDLRQWWARGMFGRNDAMASQASYRRDTQIGLAGQTRQTDQRAVFEGAARGRVCAWTVSATCSATDTRGGVVLETHAPVHPSNVQPHGLPSRHRGQTACAPRVGSLSGRGLHQ